MDNSISAHLNYLASILAHISASVRTSTDPAEIVHLLEQASQIIEHIVPESAPALAAELAQINVILAMWKKSWPTACRIPQQKTLLAAQTKNWSDKTAKFARMA